MPAVPPTAAIALLPSIVLEPLMTILAVDRTPPPSAPMPVLERATDLLFETVTPVSVSVELFAVLGFPPSRMPPPSDTLVVAPVSSVSARPPVISTFSKVTEFPATI